MLTIIDRYLLKRYLATFTVMLLLFIPIGIVIDVSEKVNKMIENKVPFDKIAVYYYDFVIYFANLLFPIMLFLSVIWFTSKLANNTEIIAILSSGISFTRFLRPYLIGATIVSLFSLLMGFYLVPKASEGFKSFRYNYLIGNGQEEMRDNSDVFRQISDDEFIYVSNFNTISKMAFNFSLEKFKGDKLEYKISANRIKFNPRDSTYTMFGYTKRTVGELNDVIEHAEKKDAHFKFELDDLTPTVYVAETLAYGDLLRLLNVKKNEATRTSIPISSFCIKNTASRFRHLSSRLLQSPFLQ